MATYEYRCEDCHATFTIRERISRHDREKEPRPCPECGGTETRQLFSTFFAKTRSKT